MEETEAVSLDVGESQGVSFDYAHNEIVDELDLEITSDNDSDSTTIEIV